MEPTGHRATPEQKAEMDRAVAEHTAEYRARNERVGALRNLVAERRTALACAKTDSQRWRAHKLLELALERLRVAK